ncbi:MAG: hypothetical protein ACK55I_39040, partial [bacterium]
FTAARRRGRRQRDRHHRALTDTLEHVIDVRLRRLAQPFVVLFLPVLVRLVAAVAGDSLAVLAFVVSGLDRHGSAVGLAGFSRLRHLSLSLSKFSGIAVAVFRIERLVGFVRVVVFRLFLLL